MSSDYEFSDYEYEDDEESMDVEVGMSYLPIRRSL